MPQQLTANDFIPSKVKDSTRGFIEMFYQEGAESATLADCRNRHEGYGLLAEAHVALCGAMDSVKAGMKDCLKTLSGEDAAFLSAADATYFALVDLAIAAVQMGVQDMSVIRQMMDRIQRTPLPLEEYAEGIPSEDGEDLPDAEDVLGSEE